jgi:hypothetical protein
MGGVLMIEWVQNNLELVLGGTTLTAFITYIFLRLTSVILPRFLNQLKDMFAVIISNLFGMSFGEGVDMVEKLPVLNKFDDIGQELEMQIYLKLIDIKKQIASPLYTEAEKVPLEKLYDYLYAQVKEKLPQEIKDVLEQLDQIQAGE